MIAAHRTEYLRFKALNVANSAMLPFDAAVNTNTPLSATLYAETRLLSIPINTIYLTAIIFFVVILFVLLNQHRLPIFLTLFWAMIASQCLGIGLYGCDSFGRLLLPVMPLMFTLGGICLDKILYKYAI